MWLLILLVGAAAYAQPLSLKVTAPHAVPLGEPFTITVTLTNTAGEWVRLAPIFTPSPRYLTLRLSSGRETLPVPTVVDETEGSITPASFVLLAPKMFIGRSFRVSPEPEDSVVAFNDLRPHCYTLAASLRIHRFNPEFTWADAIRPLETTADASPVEICFDPPLRASLLRHRKLLMSSDAEERLQAYAYFANVRDADASAALVRLLGDPASWRSRATDEMAVLKMMERQCDARFLPYLRVSVGGRYSETATKAIDCIGPPRR